MKVEVKHKAKSVEQSYPYIGIIDDMGLVVLFNNKREGMCLCSGTSGHKIGYYSNSWSESEFQKVNGEITLSND